MQKFHAGVVSLVLVASGCSNGSGAAGTAESDVVLAGTAAPTAEVERFVVDVGDITLTRRGGGTVSILPRATRVDLVQLGSIGELVGAAQLDGGSYTSLAMVLDFTDAEVVLAGASTEAVVRDCDGALLDGPLPVEVEFADGDRPFFAVSQRHLFRLDFDLAQSLTVDATLNEVEFCPVLHVQVDRGNARPIAAGGVLQSVDAQDGTFIVARRGGGSSPRDRFLVATGGATVFQVDGAVFIGGPGLGALPGAIGQHVLVFGSIDGANGALRATAVEAGAGVPGNGQDLLTGLVVGRTGGAGADATLTVFGASRRSDGGDRRCGAPHAVTLSLADTKVVRRGAADALDTDAIAVGQQVEVYGVRDGTTMDATAADAVIRLLPTAIEGAATAAAADDRLVLDVARFGALPANRFDFTVAGQQEASPDAWVLDVTGLETGGIAAGERVLVTAWLNGVGIADDADAVAIAIRDRADAVLRLHCRWAPPRDGVVVATASQSITIDVAEAHSAQVGSGPDATTLADAPMPTIRPARGLGEYRLLGGGRAFTYRQFDAFRQAVEARAAQRAVVKIVGIGAFDAATQEFRAAAATVVFAR